MTKEEEDKQLATLEIIRNRMIELPSKIITLGFDGFIDSVVKVIKHKNFKGDPSYFESAEALGEYIVEKGQKSFSIELEELTTKLGGNMPIMANALACMGPQASCIGPLGYPDIHPVFRHMSPNCHLYSFANPGLSKVLEFNSGKIMLAEMTGLNHISWDFIKENVGIDTFLRLFTTSDLIALLNWSELDNSTAIWKGLLNDVLPKSVSSKRPIGFFDLSDCSKRGDQSVREAMELVKSFSVYWNVVLSLNLNEATLVHGVLSATKQGEKDVEEMCEEVFSILNIHTVIVHSAKQSIARNSDGLYRRKSFFINEPTISSGAGDNFNAGFCVGKLMDLKTGTCLAMGNASSKLYMQSARSPAVAEVVEFLSHNLASL
jgi:hypothetical protein